MILPLDISKNKKVKEYLKKNFIPSLQDNNLIKDILSKLLEDSKNLSNICSIINDIYLKIYFYADYKLYQQKSFELNLDILNIKK